MIYSPKRILTPLKRVDFDPKGERNMQNRGVSGYEPISWDEALDIVADEIDRIKREVGPGAILTTASSHHLWGNVGYRHSAYFRFMNLVGFTYGEHNPDSWEGWHWGGMHMWGNSHRLGIPEQYDLLEDALKHTEMIVFWSADPETTGGGIYAAFESTSAALLAQGAGRQDGLHRPLLQPHRRALRRQVVRAAAGHRRRLRPGHRLHLADRGHLRQGVRAPTATVGFDEWKDYVLGETDGVPKTPEWAEGESGIPAREIRALAREWGAKKTMLAAGGLGGWGGACRSATGNEWARTMIALAAMQGLGKPGSNIWGTTQGAPGRRVLPLPRLRRGRHLRRRGQLGRRLPLGLPHVPARQGAHPQPAPLHRGPDGPAPAHPRGDACTSSCEWRGKGFCGSSIESQFQKYEYPAPGYPHVEMYYRYGGSFFGTMTETNRYVKAYREGKVPLRGQPGHLVRGRGQVRRHHPAGLHQLRALGHQRVRQLLGLHPRHLPSRPTTA